MEFSCAVWHHSITDEESENLERVQKVACRIILKEEYDGYDSALETLNLQRLDERRLKLCLQFAKKCTKHDKVSAMFPLNDTELNLRNPEKYEVKFARTGRLFNSAVPSIQRLLNDNP